MQIPSVVDMPLIKSNTLYFLEITNNYIFTNQKFMFNYITGCSKLCPFVGLSRVFVCVILVGSKKSFQIFWGKFLCTLCKSFIRFLEFFWSFILCLLTWILDPFLADDNYETIGLFGYLEGLFSSRRFWYLWDHRACHYGRCHWFPSGAQIQERRNHRASLEIWPARSV